MGRSGEEGLCPPLPPASPTHSPKCPRCNSADTKFCYYNNYSTTQPRYFCKDCKRYWTEGGSLRNVPVGGGLRRNKKTKQEGSPGPEHTSKRYKSSSHCPSNFDINPKDAELNHLLHNLNSSPYRRGISASPSTSDLPDMSDLSYALDARFYNGGEEASQHRFSENAGFAGYVGTSAAEESLQGDATRASYHQPLGSSRVVGMTLDPSEAGVGGFSTSRSSTTSSVGANERYSEPREQPSNKGSPSPLDHQGQLQQKHGHFREDKDERNMQLASSQCSNMYEPQFQGGKLAEQRLIDADVDDAFSNVVRISYPFDWHQVSEWLFGGTGDFLYYVIPGGGGFDTGAT